MKKATILSLLLLNIIYSIPSFTQEITQEATNINTNTLLLPTSIENTKNNEYSIIPYFGVHYTNYLDRGFVGAEDVQLWKPRTNILFGVDLYKNTKIVDFGFGFDISSQSITDTGSIIDSVLNNNKQISTQTFPILSFYATLKKDFVLYNKNFYVSGKAGFVMNYNITQALIQHISQGQIIPPNSIGGGSVDICDSIFDGSLLVNSCHSQLPNGGVVNIPNIDFSGYPTTDINSNLNNSLKINGSYLFGLSFGYLVDKNIDVALYYNYKMFAMLGHTELILPTSSPNLVLNLSDSGNGSAVAKELGIKIGYRF